MLVSSMATNSSGSVIDLAVLGRPSCGRLGHQLGDSAAAATQNFERSIERKRIFQSRHLTKRMDQFVEQGFVRGFERCGCRGGLPILRGEPEHRITARSCAGNGWVLERVRSPALNSRRNGVYRICVRVWALLLSGNRG